MADVLSSSTWEWDTIAVDIALQGLYTYAPERALDPATTPLCYGNHPYVRSVIDHSIPGAADRFKHRYENDPTLEEREREWLDLTKSVRAQQRRDEAAGIKELIKDPHAVEQIEAACLRFNAELQRKQDARGADSAGTAHGGMMMGALSLE